MPTLLGGLFFDKTIVTFIIKIYQFFFNNINTFHVGQHYFLLSSFEWDPTSKIDFSLILKNDFLSKGSGYIGCKMLTPFENWMKTLYEQR